MDLKVLISASLLMVILIFSCDSNAELDNGTQMSTTNMAAADVFRQHTNFTTKPRKRGKRGGVRARIRRRGVKKPFMPVIILSNARSLCNKVDELAACAKYFHRESSVLCFSETWMNEKLDDKLFQIDGFHLVRSDRTLESQKDGGGGVCFYFNEQWTNVKNVHIKSKYCDSVMIISNF